MMAYKIIDWVIFGNSSKRVVLLSCCCISYLWWPHLCRSKLKRNTSLLYNSFASRHSTKKLSLIPAKAICVHIAACIGYNSINLALGTRHCWLQACYSCRRLCRKIWDCISKNSSKTVYGFDFIATNVNYCCILSSHGVNAIRSDRQLYLRDVLFIMIFV